ncbi:hypothetical protein [Mammaliicoccus sciuri]|uniref:hypothetical protein n=1 Tax=Mammaliicoccus sciuri TaxID=1296 RepID=UPI001FB24928|nr:hypothetical protein [Mammaliicoccus sciuri]MCJ1778731.1 hypothetical protein [Mammaliicoccus sciuri]
MSKKSKYMKKYNELNKERTRERNRRNYLKRKAKRKQQLNELKEADKELLDWLDKQKQSHISEMSPARLKRREQTQKSIYEKVLY